MAVFQKTIPKKEVIQTEVKDCIVGIWASHVKISIEEIPDSEDLTLIIETEKKKMDTRLEAEKLKTLEIHQYVLKVAEKLYAML